MDIYSHPKGEVYNYSLPPPLGHFVVIYKFIDFNSEMPVQIFWSIQLSFQAQYGFLFPLLSYIIFFFPSCDRFV
jgi:hypothetical protein